MGIFSKFEGKVDDAFDGMASSVFKSPIEPTQIAKRCEKQMIRNKLVGKGVQYAPTLYTVLVNNEDDQRLFGFYPTMAGELETYLVGAAGDAGLTLECRPLVRFIADDGLKSGKFDVIAEVVTSNIISDLREEEAEYYGLGTYGKGSREPYPARRQSPSGMRPVGTNKRSNEENARIARKYEKSAVNRPASESVARVPSDRAIDYQQRDDIDFSGLDAIGSSDEDADLFERYDGSEVDYEQYEAGGNHAGGHIAGAAASNRSESGGYSSYDEYAQDHAANYGIQRGVLVNARTGDVYHLENDNILIGREESCDISIPDASISRAHARMSLDNMGSWTITDLNSTNGTSVNGHKVDDAKLHFGDQITLGTTILLFQKG